MKDVLTLAQWLSPAFPVGAFAFSGGLETAVREGWATNAAEVEAWVRDSLTFGAGRADVVLLALAYKTDDIAAIEAQAMAFQTAAERLEEMRQLGAAFARTVRDVWQIEVGSSLYPLSVGQAARLRGLPLDMAAALFAQGYTANIVSAAIRLVPLGQTEGQAVIAQSAELCDQLGRAADSFGEDDLFSVGFLSDIAAMRHETLSPRIFQS